MFGLEPKHPEARMKPLPPNPPHATTLAHLAAHLTCISSQLPTHILTHSLTHIRLFPHTPIPSHARTLFVPTALPPYPQYPSGSCRTGRRPTPACLWTPSRTASAHQTAPG